MGAGGFVEAVYEKYKYFATEKTRFKSFFSKISVFSMFYFGFAQTIFPYSFVTVHS
jgi:hypothetical protein